MTWASAYAPVDVPRLPRVPHLPPNPSPTCPDPCGSGSTDAGENLPICADSPYGRELENVQADMQRHINDIKQSHARWLPGRFGSIRRQLLFIARLSAEDALPKDDVMAPLWPPVPRSKDLAKHASHIDIHGHVIGLKLWAHAVCFVCRHDMHLTVEQKTSLCVATARILDEAAQARLTVGGYDRWRLHAAKKQIEKITSKRSF